MQTVEINKELYRVIWGIIIKNFMHKYSFIVSKLVAVGLKIHVLMQRVEIIKSCAR